MNTSGDLRKPLGMPEAKVFGAGLPPTSVFLPCAPPGDIQVGMMDKKGQLEVEIIRARGLVVKPGSKTLPGKTEEISPSLLIVRFVSMSKLPFSPETFLMEE